MAQAVDPAVIETVGLQVSKTGEPPAIIPHERSRFTNTFELHGHIPGVPCILEIKIGCGIPAGLKFKGEYESLKAITKARRWFSPRTHGWGLMHEELDKYFIVTDYLNVMLEHKGDGSSLKLSQKLSKMHRKAAPIPDGHSTPKFGFPVTTYCGEIGQDNTWKDTWSVFFVENRLRPILRIILQAFGSDPELEQQVERIIKEVVPRLIGNDVLGKIVPSLLHGNLLYSKRSRGEFYGCPGVEDVVLEPSSFYGHSEYDLGAASVYGFPQTFFEEYHKYIPKHKPKADWRYRVQLYELYHRLIAYATYGRAYRERAVSIIRILIIKFGNPLVELGEGTDYQEQWY